MDQAVNAAVGRETPTVPVGNYSQHSVRRQRSQDAEVTSLDQPCFIFTFGHCTNLTTQLRQLLLLGGLPTCTRGRVQAPVSSPHLFSLTEHGNGGRGLPSHSYYGVNAKQRGTDLSIQDDSYGHVPRVVSRLGACTLTSGQRNVLTVSFPRLASFVTPATTLPMRQMSNEANDKTSAFIII